MAAKVIAPIILGLLVRLEGSLGRQDIRAGAETLAASEASEVATARSDIQRNSGQRIESTTKCHAVHDCIPELQILKTDAIGGSSDREIRANHMRRGMVDILERLVNAGIEPPHTGVLVVAEAVK